jgi:ribosomal protein L19
MHSGQGLLNHIEAEERKRIEATREYKMPDFRTGDILDVTYFTSLSEGKFNTLRGVCFAKKQVNNLRAAFKINTVVDDVNT